MKPVSIHKVSRGELSGSLRPGGSAAGLSLSQVKSLARNEVAVGHWSEGPNATKGAPDFIIVNDSNPRDFLAWINTYLADAAPITQWCRVLTIGGVAEIFEDDPPNLGLGSLSEAWAGAIIGECVAQTGRGDSRSTLNFVSCLSTYSYAVARSLSVWGGRTAAREVAEKIDSCRLMMSLPDRRIDHNSLSFIWATLTQVDGRFDEVPRSHPVGEAILKCCKDFFSHGAFGSQSLDTLSQVLPDAVSLGALDDLSAEKRLMLLEAFARNIQSDGIRDESHRRAAEFAMGYIASRIGGGWRNIDLTAEWSGIVPLAPVWFGIFHAMSERSVFGAPFGGLSRLVLREVESPFSLTERPNADIHLDELPAALSGEGPVEKAPFRTVNSKSILIELVPGVTTMIAFDARREAAVRSPKLQDPPPNNQEERIHWLIREVEFLKRVLEDRGLLNGMDPASDQPPKRTRGRVKKQDKLL